MIAPVSNTVAGPSIEDSSGMLLRMGFAGAAEAAGGLWRLSALDYPLAHPGPISGAAA